MQSPPRVSEQMLREALDLTGSPEKAAPIFNVSRRTVYRWMEHYDIRLMPQVEKRCTECGEWKPMADFYLTNRGKPRPSCRICFQNRTAAYKRADPVRLAAHEAVKHAVRSGRLVAPETCTSCGAATRLNAHHEDYTRQLDVEWLCGKCHSARHSAVPEKAA